jgi:hypothetical protein
MMRAFAATQLLQLAGCVANSANLSVFWVVCGVYAFSWICLQVLQMVRAIQGPVARPG